MSSLDFTSHHKQFAGVSLDLKYLSVDNLEQCYALTVSVGFGTTKAEQRAVLKTCQGFAIGAFTCDNQLISMFSSIPHDDTLAYIFQVVTHPDYQGRGIGSYMFQQGVKGLGSRNLMLDSKPNATNFYIKNGFKVYSLNCAIVQGVPKIPADYTKPGYLDIKQMSPDLICDVVKYEADVHHSNMKLSFELWNSPEIVGFAAYRAGVVCGTIAAWGIPIPENTYRICQFIAEDYDIAKALMAHVIEEFPSNASFKWYLFSRNPQSMTDMPQDFAMDDKHVQDPNDAKSVRLYTCMEPGGIQSEKIYCAYANIV